MRRKTAENAAPAAPDPYLGLTPNQVVAFNLAQAREWKGWTQDQAAEALEPYLGKRWSKASVSQAERSIAGKFVRNFDADEIVAFARAFELPLGWFFMPPPPWSDQPGVPVKLKTPDAEQLGTALALLIDLVFGDETSQPLLAMRLDAWLQQRPPQLTHAQERIARMVRHRIESLARATIDDLASWQTMLRSMANQLEHLETRARASVDDELAAGTTRLAGEER
ncbi:MAG: helix-turn-helix domain-containing protein [Acidimicrobiales bacterium]